MFKQTTGRCVISGKNLPNAQRDKSKLQKQFENRLSSSKRGGQYKYILGETNPPVRRSYGVRSYGVRRRLVCATGLTLASLGRHSTPGLPAKELGLGREAKHPPKAPCLSSRNSHLDVCPLEPTSWVLWPAVAHMCPGVLVPQERWLGARRGHCAQLTAQRRGDATAGSRRRAGPRGRQSRSWGLGREAGWRAARS